MAEKTGFAEFYARDRATSRRWKCPTIMSSRSTQLYFASGPALIVALLSGCASPTERRSAPGPRYVLKAAQSWQLNLPGDERFDASGLFLAPNGDLLTVNDRTLAVYRIQFLPGLSAAAPGQLP